MFNALADAIAIEIFYQDNCLVEPFARAAWARNMGAYVLRLAREA